MKKGTTLGVLDILRVETAPCVSATEQTEQAPIQFFHDRLHAVYLFRQK
jgi:hypothetical protein